MANAAPQDSFPKSGKVNEVCKQWTVREDGALAYRLQNEEISGHLEGNKYRNAVVRQDFPKAVDEQIREQQLAEQAAAVYHQMLAEQEEVDVLYAKQLANKLKIEEDIRRQSREVHDERIARQIAAIDDDGLPDYVLNRCLEKPDTSVIDAHEDYPTSYHAEPQSYYTNSPRRKSQAMPLPGDNIEINSVLVSSDNVHDNYLYTEPYKTADHATNLDSIDVDDFVLALDEVKERELQERKDALLALKLQQQEDNSEQSLLNRDRLLAIEAQDKELAKLLQERERQKLKRARERAKQKALLKKQQQLLQLQGQEPHQIMPDDSYSSPADMLPSPSRNVSNNLQPYPHLHDHPACADEDFNYSSPVDMLPLKNHDNNTKVKYRGSPVKKSYDEYNCDDNKIINCDIIKSQAVRPTQLDLKSPLTSSNKPRYPDPDISENSLKHTNIAMAIDPTYNRRSQYSVPYYDTSSSTVTTSTSSSSPGIVLPPPDMAEFEEDLGPAPPYMPIQGQRRTSSLEKKTKKKSKDGCKQQ